MINKKGRLIIFSGPSGVGKGTILKELFKNKDLKLAYSISMTTRHQREGEVNGLNYFFVTREEFEQAIKEDKLLEHAEFVGNYYGTPIDYCNEQINKGNNVILEIEVQGATQVMKKVPEALSIFLVPPSLEELERRIRERNSEPENIVQLRLQKAREEILLQNEYDYVVINDDVKRVTEEIANIIRKEMNEQNN